MDDDSVDISDLSFDEKIAILEEDLPEPVRAFLHSSERDEISLRLTQKYRLHADQASAFEKAYLYMLLGVNTPEDFVEDLRQANISADIVRGLTSDINEQIFKKLQQKELYGGRKQETPTVPETRQTQPQVPVMQVVPPPAPPVRETPPASVTPQEPPPYNLMRPDALVSAPPAQVQTPPVPAATPQPMLRTMQTDMEAMQQPGHVAAPVPYAPQIHSATTPVTPARSFQTASIPHTSIPVASRPAPAPLQPSIQVPPPKNPPPEAPGNSGTDPYREPLT